MTLLECLVGLRNRFLFRQRFSQQDLQRGYSEGKNLWWLHVRMTMFQVVVETIHTLTIYVSVLYCIIIKSDLCHFTQIKVN